MRDIDIKEDPLSQQRTGDAKVEIRIHAGNDLKAKASLKSLGIDTEDKQHYRKSR